MNNPELLGNSITSAPILYVTEDGVEHAGHYHSNGHYYCELNHCKFVAGSGSIAVLEKDDNGLQPWRRPNGGGYSGDGTPYQRVKSWRYLETEPDGR